MKRVVVVAAVLALAGCHHSTGTFRPGTSGLPPTSPAGDGTRLAANVRGTFRMVGGPYPGISRPLSGTITVHHDDRNGNVVQTVQTGKHGTFATRLAPGRYWFVGTSRHLTGMGCPNVHAVTVTNHGIAHVQVVCAVP